MYNRSPSIKMNKQPQLTRQAFVSEHVEHIPSSVPFRSFFIEGDLLYIRISHRSCKKLLAMAYQYHQDQQKTVEPSDPKPDHDLYTFLNTFAKLDLTSILRARFEKKAVPEFYFPIDKLPIFVKCCKEVFPSKRKRSSKKA